MITAPDSYLLAAIEQCFGEPVELVDARPHSMQSSCPLTEISVRNAAGGRRELLLKDLSGRWRHPGPEFLHDQRREIEVYRRLRDHGLAGLRFLGAEVDPRRDRYWLFVERVDGIPLWQSGDPLHWCSAAEWLAGLHELVPRPDGPPWFRYDADYFGRWLGRALAFAPDCGLAALERPHARAIERLAQADAVIVHGDYYPSNVLVRSPPETGVCPIDFELTGVGPAVLDLAALVTGLSGTLARAVLDAYQRRRSAPLGDRELEELLLCARLHLAIRWLGWMPGWQPPEHQRFDWVAEAHAVAAALKERA